MKFFIKLSQNWEKAWKTYTITILTPSQLLTCERSSVGEQACNQPDALGTCWGCWRSRLKGARWGQQKVSRGLAACAQRKLGNKPWTKTESHTHGCPPCAQHGTSVCLPIWFSQQPCREGVLVPILQTRKLRLRGVM